jgi:hypothetical protein
LDRDLLIVTKNIKPWGSKKRKILVNGGFLRKKSLGYLKLLKEIQQTKKTFGLRFS